MGQNSIYRPMATRTSLLVLGAALLCLAFASTALAGPPFHPRKAAQDISGLNHACGAAVDSKGDVYASSAGESKVKVYNPAHALLTSISNANEPCGLAVDSKGELFVSEKATGKVLRYKPNAYPFAGTPTYGSAEPIDSSGNARGISVDRFDDRLYVAEGNRIAVYESDGTFAAVNEVQEVLLSKATGGSFRLAMPGEGGPGVNEIQRVDFAPAQGGTLTLSFKGQKTGPIPYNATPAAVQTALAGLSTVGAGNVGVVGDPAGGRPWWVEFKGALAATDVPSLSGDGAALQPLNAGRAMLVGVEALSDISGPIPYNATAGEVQAALEGLTTIGAGDVEVQSPVSGKFVITFKGALANTDVAMLQPEGSALVAAFLSNSESVKGFNGYVGEGKLSAAGGVAPYTYKLEEASQGTHYLFAADAATDRVLLFSGDSYKTLKLRRELAGPKAGEDFGFAAAGAYLAVDPGNRGAEEKCASVAEQACTAGHFLVYDDAHNVVDEFDAGGEFLDQFTNAALADAGPTALALDRSGGANDGTIYLSTGAAAGAKVLAFGPLAAPSRSPLPARPPSRVLAAASVVATDSHGDVYLRAGSLIRVYTPAGEEIKVGAKEKGIEDGKDPTDIEVDAAGNVYVRDANTNVGGDEIVTYYAPSAYPPVKGTTYTRHEPAIASAANFGGGSGDGPESIALNPSNDRLLVFGGKQILEFDSAAKGSTLLRNVAPSLDFPQFGGQVGVCGTSGAIYVAINPGRVYVINSAGTEFVARITGVGSPPGGGVSPTNPRIAVDQSNCHVLAFDNHSGAAQEYDASGAFVAEFVYPEPESFTKELSRAVGIAIDNSGGATAGRLYIAFDDAKAGTPDLWAFGPLSYGTPPIEPKEFKLTVAKTGTGTGTVTSSPAGINCGLECAAEYAEGTKVTLSATPTGGSTFTGWSGAGCSGTGKCEVTMSEAKSVSAEFKAAAKPKFTLKVKLTGTGTGTVTSSPAGINCGISCEAEYDEGTAVALTGAPGANAKAVAWTGCDSVNGEDKCLVTISAAREVTATFNLETHLLSVAKTGTGTGTVTSAPAGIECGATCSFAFEHATKVTLSATPTGGSTFTGWSGAGCSGTGKCEVTMSEAKSVSAEFKAAAKPKFTLKVKLTGTGTGTVTSSPAGINCGISCEAEYDEGTAVALTGAPGANAKAVAWTGCDSVNGEDKCLVTISAAREVTATFNLETHLLSVAKTGTGTGTVTSAPAGIECGATCSFAFEHATKVTLSATPTGGSSFTGWSGAGCSGTGKCEVTMSEAKSVSAEFKEEAASAEFPLTVATEGPGSGTITSSPGLINCNPFCEDEFEEGTKVTLSATAAPGSTLYSWRHCDSGGVNGRLCTVTMDKAKTVSAVFYTTHDLSVSKAPGSGLGKVQSSPGGILCLAGCSETTAAFREGTKVLLKQTPAKHFHFLEWQGDCSGSGACEVMMGEDHEVEAKFAQDAKHLLSIAKEGGGQGTVKSSPSGINCGATCASMAASFYAGEVIELSATPTKGTTFGGWSGGGCSGTGVCKVTMSEAEEVVAEFE